MRAAISSVLLLLLLLPDARAGPTFVEPGQVYAGGTRVAFAELGVSFVIPKAWKGRLTPEGEAFLMGSDTQPGLLIGIGDRGLSLAEIREVLSSPIPLDMTTVLEPAGPAQVQARRVENRYSVQAGEQRFTGWAEARLLDNGAAIAMIAVGPKPKASKTRLARVLRSVKIVKAPKPAPSSGPWAKRLRGNTLLYMKTQGGLSTKKRIELCQSGRFAFRGHESYLSGGFSGVGSDGSSGTWSIQGSALTLTWANGNVDRRQLRADGGKTYVDGVRWFVQAGTSSCR